MATILVADDDAIVQQLLGYILAPEGHEVVQARNGLEALALLDTRQIDLVISDVQMPLLDGAGLLSFIRAMVSGPRLLLIGRDLRAPGVTALVRQADAALAKPLEPRVLTETVRRLLAGAAVTA